MVKECVSNTASCKHFYSSEKKCPTKAIFGPELSDAEIDASVEEELFRLLILEFSIKQLFYSGLLDIK